MMDRPLTRRALLSAAIPLFAAPVLSPRARAAVAALAARETLRVGVLLRPAGEDDGNGDSSGAAWGIALGVEESARTGALFGIDVEVIERVVGRRDDAATAARAILSPGVAALVLALDAEQCAAVAPIAAAGGTLLVSVGCAPVSAAPDTACRAPAAHIAPSAGTVRRARAAYARRRSGHSSSGAPVALWHHTLRRFGAEQLNERFRRRFSREMTSGAWAGWAAMKIVTEAALRSRATRGGEIARYLTSAGARFDGHKGEPLVVDPRSGEVRQPLYVLLTDSDGRERVVAELSSADCYGPVSSAPRGGGSCVAPAPVR